LLASRNISGPGHLQSRIRKAVGVSARKVASRLPPDTQSRIRTITGRNTAALGTADEPIFQINADTIARSRQRTDRPDQQPIRSATWFIPPPAHVAFGGLYTIFRFMSDFRDRGIEPQVAIYGDDLLDVSRLRTDLEREFPNLAGVRVLVIRSGLAELARLDATDAAFCTYWTTAYLLLRFNRTARKFYFVQDFEPSFYEAGPQYALAESTYRFGFTGIFNTPGLAEAIGSRYGMPGVVFVPAVDRRYSDGSRRPRTGPVRIFFYARPNRPRNAFLLGVAVMRQLAARYGDRIEMVTAGGDWSPEEFQLGGNVTALGLLPTIEEVAELYRSCDIGFVFMFSKHPSYQPLEFMASGVATVTNTNEDNLWLLRNEHNCLLAEPSPTAMAEAIGRLVDDTALRDRIVAAGLAAVSRDWTPQLNRVWSFVQDPGPATAG
jgi:glycosyltransferase involved in cell wall biosynthesis